MCKYDKIKGFPEEDFRRLTGVKKNTFAEMVNILREAKDSIYRRSGRKGKLSVEDKLLMTLEYLREYRTYFHVASSYGVSESACYRTCRFVEDTLIKSKKFSLPGKKALVKSDTEFEVILVDASETPIERPKKK